MLLAEAEPVDWTLSLVLVLTWITVRVVRRRVPVWLQVASALLALLCLPAGVVAGEAELRGVPCSPDNLCFSVNEVHWWINGILGLLTTVVLALLTLLVDRGRGREQVAE